ncbi:MAG TPA: NUDIX domain-containing protein [Armatimonadetes bacterium]|jgi:8-oxo-dGTP pyrophosphatase MutT (NUDIX family)|nr:NUDIX domain-containing protein [Armatimonadota bacterium]
MALVIDESWYRKPAGIREEDSAGGVIVRLEQCRLLVALVLEGTYQLCVLPKGHVEPGESFEEAARREIAEEAGLTDLTFLGELGTRERLDFARKEWKRTHYFLYLTRQAHGTPTDRSHAYTLRWVPLDADLPLFWPEQAELIRSNRERIRQLAGA